MTICSFIIAGAVDVGVMVTINKVL
jgi:hypothetical protein